ncbi:hypothetical protein ABBQ38_004764 [Trebouxia sp. C0009 RCD-2024]
MQFARISFITAVALVAIVMHTLTDVCGGASEIAASAHTDSMCRPQQVHLALTADPTEMRVSWKTLGSSCDARVEHWHLRRSNLAQNATEGLRQRPDGNAISSSYSSDDMCASPAKDFDFAPLNLHTYVMTQLEAGAWYEYQLTGLSDALSFRASPAPGPSSKVSFVVYGDMGESDHARAKSPGAAATAEYVSREVIYNEVDLVLHVGDISYANGDPEIWDTFMDYIEPYSSRAPYMISIGNHEYDYRTGKEKHKSHNKDPSGAGSPYEPDWGNYGNDSGGECGVATARRFIMPGATLSDLPDSAVENHGRRENPPFWYSFDYGSVHFVMLSTEHDVTPGSHQYQWLEWHLEGIDRCITPWLVVGAHRPMYVVHPHKSNRIVADHLRDSLESLFNHYNVDLVLSGHVHSYARTCNVFNEKCVDNLDKGTTHVTLGCGGHKLSEVDHDQYDWLAYARTAFGYGRVTADGDRSLRLDYVTTAHGDVHDSVTLHNDYDGQDYCRGRGHRGVAGIQLGARHVPVNTTGVVAEL